MGLVVGVTFLGRGCFRKSVNDLSISTPPGAPVKLRFVGIKKGGKSFFLKGV